MIRSVLFLCALYPVFFTSKMVLGSIPEDRKSSLLVLLKENPNEIEFAIPEEQKKAILQKLEQKLLTCLLEPEPFRENIPQSLREPLCSQILKETGAVIPYLEILDLVSSFVTWEEEERAKQEEEERKQLAEAQAEEERAQASAQAQKEEEDEGSFWDFLPSFPRY